MAVNREPKDPTIVLLEMAALLLLPTLALGLALALVTEPANFAPGVLLGGIVGVTAATLRNEHHGMRIADRE